MNVLLTEQLFSFFFFSYSVYIILYIDICRGVYPRKYDLDTFSVTLHLTFINSFVSV